MLRPLPAGLLAYLFLFLDSLYAHQLHIRGSRQHSHRLDDHLVRRGGPISLNNSADISYHADILLGGQPFQVLVDTGSSDLWVAGKVHQSNDTALNASVFYAIGKVEGPIKTARLQLGSDHVENQAFIQAPPTVRNPEGTGILGLGPSSGSFILSQYPGIAGAPPLDRLFTQDAGKLNYFTILLGRSSDPTSFFSGTITIGSILPDFNSILSSPKLPISLVSEGNSHNQHFQVQLDPDGIIGPDGQAIPLGPHIAKKSEGRATAVMDCGFSLPQIPRPVAEAIYGRFKDAEFTTVDGLGGVWVVPCSTEVNVTFIFGGQRYPMHPLDMTLEPEMFNIRNVTNSNGVPACIGSFQPFTFDRGRKPTYDIVLGMAFMRNVYTLFDYADFVLEPDTTDADKDPYIQMLSITDKSQAHQDFVKVRLGGIDTTGDQELLDGPKQKKGHKTAPAIYIAVAAVVVTIFLAVVIFMIWRKRRQRKEKNREKLGE